MKPFISSLLLLTLLLGSGIQNAHSQDSIVNIPDTAFLHALIDEGVDTNEDSLISYEEAEAVIYLNVTGNMVFVMGHWVGEGRIKSLVGIEAFTNLDSLDCKGNKITSLDISKNTFLKKLNCGGNQLSSLDLSNNPALLYLYCFDNQLTSLDLSNNPALLFLYCGGNPLTSLNVSNNTELESMVIQRISNLHEVCVWNDFKSDSIYIDELDSPNVCFETDCDGICSGTGVEKFSSTGLSIYPNPANTFLTIETGITGLYDIEITSMNGCLLYHREYAEPTIQLDLSSFQKGLYFITVRSRDQVWTEKIIKL